MSHLGNTEFLEYWFGIGKNLGLTDEQAIEYAESQAESYL